MPSASPRLEGLSLWSCFPRPALTVSAETGVIPLVSFNQQNSVLPWPNGRAATLLQRHMGSQWLCHRAEDTDCLRLSLGHVRTAQCLERVRITVIGAAPGEALRHTLLFTHCHAALFPFPRARTCCVSVRGHLLLTGLLERLCSRAASLWPTCFCPFPPAVQTHVHMPCPGAMLSAASLLL